MVVSTASTPRCGKVCLAVFVLFVVLPSIGAFLWHSCQPDDRATRWHNDRLSARDEQMH